MKTVKKLLGERIKELRKARGLSQEQLTDQLGIDSKHLSRIEVGNSYPSMDTLADIAAALQVEMKEFFDFEHRNSTKELAQSIVRMTRNASEEQIRLIYKLVRAVLN